MCPITPGVCAAVYGTGSGIIPLDAAVGKAVSPRGLYLELLGIVESDARVAAAGQQTTAARIQRREVAENVPT